MSIQAWFRDQRIGRWLAVSLVVLATGGLMLAKSSGGGAMDPVRRGGPEETNVLLGGSNTVSVSGTGLRGRFALSHTKVLEGGERRVFAELDLRADGGDTRGRARAPLAIAVVLDTSGSMEGAKIAEAKRSVGRMLREMRDDDEIAVVRYNTSAEVVQPLARLGEVRGPLSSRVDALSAGGGTNIPAGLSRGIAELDTASRGRVRRVLLASDGLDSSRVQAEQIARRSADHGVTVSSLGIGLDFDESHMGGLAQAGHGNFAFVEDASALAAFLRRELEETAATTVEGVKVELRLPNGVRFIEAMGADARRTGDDALEIRIGSLFAGDERRVILDLGVTIPAGEVRTFEGRVAWNVVLGDTVTARIPAISLTGTREQLAMDEGRDGAVFANATSVLASARQIQAAEAYRRGDTARAQALIAENEVALSAAAAAAPAAAKPRLAAQSKAYEATKRDFSEQPAGSDKGRAAAKAAAAKDFNNISRMGY